MRFCYKVRLSNIKFEEPHWSVSLEMREKIKLQSSAGTGHFYTTDKNKRTKTEKIEIKKYDPVARKHVIYKESKI